MKCPIFLGFLQLMDMTVNRRGGQFWCIQIKDQELLESIKKIIQSEHTIGVRKRKNNIENIYSLQIGSIEMCNDLRELGYSERKTRNLIIPNVPKKYFSDFVRGYFDGDGNVWSGYVHKERKNKLLVLRIVFTSCSKNFLDLLKLGLEDFCIEKGVLSKGKGDYYRLTYSIHNSLKLYEFMYNGVGTSKLFPSRKRDVFAKYIKNAAVAQR